MRLLAITDLHESQAAQERILSAAGPVDLILLGGDLTNFGSPDDAQQLIQQAQATGTEVLAVAGNCDSPEIDRRLVELEVSLAGRGLIHAGVGLHGLSAMPPWGSTMYQFTEDELAAMLETGYSQIRGAEHHVILSHAPPYGGELDRISGARHVGSTALRSFIDRTQPELVVCGHIHEARGTEMLGRTTVVNCGAGVAGFYAMVKLGDKPQVELRQL